MSEGDYKMASRRDYEDRTRHQDQQGSASANEEELASKTLHIQSKRFYLDVKQNRRGRFLKIAEVSSGGRKSRILMSMSIAIELRDHLQTFDDHLRRLGSQLIHNEELRTAVISREERKYYLDLKENERGTFLRIAMVGVNASRTQIAVPAQGIEELHQTLTSLIEEFASEDDNDSVESLPAIELTTIPESKRVRVGNKSFFFDTGSNNRGVFLRISEVRPNYRTSITIPEKVWSHFRDNIDDFIRIMDHERNSATSVKANSQLNTDDKCTILPNSMNNEKN